MSVVIQKEHGVYLNLRNYLVDLYKNTVINFENDENQFCAFIPKLSFLAVNQPHIKHTPCDGSCVAEPYKNEDNETFDAIKLNTIRNVTVTKRRQSRKRKSPYNQGEIDMMNYHKSIIDHLKLTTSNILSDYKQNMDINDNRHKEDFTKIFHQSCGFVHCAKMVNEQLKDIKNIFDVSDKSLIYTLKNNCPYSHCLKIQKNTYLIPEHCHFICSDITNLDILINDCLVNGNFGCIVMDPPWQNKSVKRSKKYNLLGFDDISTIPFDKLCIKNCLVVVWVTNKQKILRWVKDVLFLQWNITLIAEWHWVKLTVSGEPVFPWDSLHKKPYETILLGCYQYTNLPQKSTYPQNLVICSTPSTIHSHKPPLNNVLKLYFNNIINDSTRCLELFARNLTAGWTSWGNEVLLLQDVCYFEKKLK